MIFRIKNTINLIQNMGLRYVLFRVYYVLLTKTGLLKKKFPINPPFKETISLKEWRNHTPPFFFEGKNITGLPKNPSNKLKKTFEEIQKGRFTFFGKLQYDLGSNYDWITNSETKYRYDISKHWTQIQDFSETAGDIKFVWEKARFSYLYDVIRYDYHFQEDQSAFVFSEIEDFINKNPINQGPNYKCSQEISIRILNWTFALYYYKDSDNLTPALFDKIINAIYWQLHHVYHNIHFSRIAVRNNHAITETLMLYLSNKLFPFITETKKWSLKGEKWFEQEIAYQIYDDGTYLQFSMNYHRVVVQLLTWAIRLAKLNNDKLNAVVYDKAEKSLIFLDTCMDNTSGELPNYGSNDGALFFKLTDDDYRNYKSQLNDLRAVLNNEIHSESESTYWYGVSKAQKISIPLTDEITCFKDGGYYIIQDEKVKTFIKCGSYKDRPAQSDNLHIDIWIDGINYLRDSGSYKYNTNQEFVNYFTGCEGHNTLSIAGKNQMLKGKRFIWYHWVKKANATLETLNDSYKFTGEIEAFKEIGKNIKHKRVVIKKKSINNWVVIDTVSNKSNQIMYQYWHINPKYKDLVKITSVDEKGNVLKPVIEEKWFSGYYGVKEKSIRLTFATSGKEFRTTISIEKA